MAHVDLVMGNTTYDQCHPNLAGGVSPYNTINHGDLRGNTLSCWAPPAMASTAAYGPSASFLCSMAHADPVMNNATYDWRHPNQVGGQAHTVQSTMDFSKKYCTIMSAANHGIHCHLWAVRARST